MTTAKTMLVTLLLVLLVALVTAEEAQERPTCSASLNDTNKNDWHCSLYLAPSSIAGAGFGIYTLSDISKGDTIGQEDLVIPILDHKKTLPYRGQEQFLSWLGYVWPSHADAFYHATTASFPTIPESMYKVDEGLCSATGVEFYNNDEGGTRMSAFAPGIASLANSNPQYANIQQGKSNGNSFVATRDIVAGSELFLNYGVEWHTRFTKKQTSATEFDTLEDYQERLSKMKLPTEQDKRDKLAQQKRRKLETDDDDDEYDNVHYTEGSSVEYYDPSEIRAALYGRGNDDDAGVNDECVDKDPNCQHWAYTGECDKNPGYMHQYCPKSCLLCNDKVEREVKQGFFARTKEIFGRQQSVQQDAHKEEGNNDDSCIDEDPQCQRWASAGECDRNPGYMHQSCAKSCLVCDAYDKEKYSKERVEWLKEHGICIENLRAGQSNKTTGNGAFANTHISKGSLIAPAPLLVLKREDLRIYEANETQAAFRNVLNFDKVMGEELLLNYCYGHQDSELLLLPYSPIVNYINHDGKEPNAEILWPPHYSKEWLESHPLDVLEMSGKLMMGFVALRDIQPGEEIVIDYGRSWEDVWEKHKESNEKQDFRHEIGVPDGFFSDAWKNQPTVYELAPLEAPLKPGEVSQMNFKHNGKPVCKNCYRVGLPSGFSQHIREFSDERGITSLYEKLLYNDILESDEWTTFETLGEEWFAQRYESKRWKFNMHYIAAWDESARVSFLRALGSGGFDVVLEGIGQTFGLDNITCFHTSFMGVSEADNSFTHADVYAGDEKGFNIIWPMIVVDGSSPELDIVSDDTNIVLSVNYEYDVAYVMGDNGYHKTSPNSYEENGQMRIVVGAYCGQVDESNAKMMHYIYDGEDPAPFCDQFTLPIKEIHWGNGHSLPK